MKMSGRGREAFALLLVGTTLVGCTSARATHASTSPAPRTAPPERDVRLRALPVGADSLPWTLLRSSPTSSAIKINYLPGCHATAYPEVAETQRSVTIRVVRTQRSAWLCLEDVTTTVRLARPLGPRVLVHAPVVDPELSPAPTRT